MQQNLSLIRRREVAVFDGDRQQYQSFTYTLKHLLEVKIHSCQDRMFFLGQFMSSQARDLVHSCLHMEAEKGYMEAKQYKKNK